MLTSTKTTKTNLYIPHVGDLVEITTKCKHTGKVGNVTKIGKKVSVSFSKSDKAAYWPTSLRCIGRQYDNNIRSKVPQPTKKAETPEKICILASVICRYLVSDEAIKQLLNCETIALFILGDASNDCTN
jgi:hypothetical protein